MYNCFMLYFVIFCFLSSQEDCILLKGRNSILYTATDSKRYFSMCKAIEISDSQISFYQYISFFRKKAFMGPQNVRHKSNKLFK